MEKKEIIILALLTFSLGMITGFLISPMKAGIGNNSGNTTHNNYGEKDPKESEKI
ncbi:MAG: hypothetical protein GX913_05745 [Clostridiales bacterium]|nr:hypothetical protein [Clostridiales bacterium]